MSLKNIETVTSIDFETRWQHGNPECDFSPSYMHFLGGPTSNEQYLSAIGFPIHELVRYSFNISEEK